MAIGVRDSTFSTGAVITVEREVRGVPDGRRGAPAAGSLEEELCLNSREEGMCQKAAGRKRFLSKPKGKIISAVAPLRPSRPAGLEG